MNTQGIKKLWYSRLFVLHAKIILGCLIFSIVFSIVRHGKPFGQLFYIALVLTLLQAEANYYFSKKFFFHKDDNLREQSSAKYLLQLLLMYLGMLIISSAIFVATMFVVFLIEGVELSSLWPHLLHNESKGFFLFFAIAILIASMILFYIKWSETLKRVQHLKEEKLIFQYETLKNQINPHFLFNSLNTLSSLLPNTNSEADKFIEKLSSVYRYVLENKDHEFVNLKQEIEFVKDYFYTHQVRDNEKIKLEIKVEDISTARVLPLSLQVLVENALKHNMATRTRPLTISIFTEGSDTIVVKNNLQRKTSLEPSSGIGLKNLQERLQFITNRELLIEKSENSYIVKLPLITN